MKPAEFGGSRTASTFGANIKISLPGQGMYLVAGERSSPASLVHSAGGKVILQISDQKLLAILPTNAYLAFRNHPQIAFIGPVAIDQERFAHFAATLNIAQD
jgi:hypothetical protein